MARARNIKPGFFESEQVGMASPGARLLFISLWQLADREGRLVERPLQIKAYAFRYDAIDAAVVSGWLQELHEAGLIVRYDADGQKLIEIPNFAKHQRPHQREEPSVLPGRQNKKPCLGTAEGPYMAPEPDLGTAEHNLGTAGAPYMRVQPDLGTAEGPYMTPQPALNPECGILNVESGMLKAQLTLAMPRETKLPPPHSAVGDWVEKVRALHPKGSSEGAVALFFAEHEKRLGGGAAFDDFAARVIRSHIAWCAYWALDGSKYAKKLEEWLRQGDYDKTPPRAVSGSGKYTPMLPANKQGTCKVCHGDGYTLPTLDVSQFDGLTSTQIEAKVQSLRIPCAECAA